jgi:uncharacterized protein
MEIFWGTILRFGQAGLDATLTLLIGVVTAGILRRMLTPAGTRKLFGSGIRGLITGWVAGMLLPVCALGVIPVARELRRSGVPVGTVLAFVLAAPLLNPISFLYGLTLAEPKVILCFAGLSLLLSTLAGLLWDWLFRETSSPTEAEQLAALADAEPAPPVGLKRILSVFVTACRELTGRDLLYYLIGIQGTAMLAALLPFGSLQHSMHHTDKLSTLWMTALALPLFSSPLSGMMKIGLMFDHGNSIGAAFVLFSLGIGMSLGTLAWLIVDFKFLRVIKWFPCYVLLIVGMGYAVEPLLFDSRKEVVDHTHAFDDYSAPYPSGTLDMPAMTLKKLQEKFGPLERPAVYCFIAFVTLGFALRLFDKKDRIEAWLVAPPKSSTPSRWDIHVPGPVLGGIAILGLVVFSVIGAYIYYPDRDQCMEQMYTVYADARIAVNTEKSEEAIRHLELWDQIVRKLEVGTFIRKYQVTEEQSKSAEALREAIEEVRDDLIANKLTDAKERFKKDVDPAYKACKAAYPK